MGEETPDRYQANISPGERCHAVEIILRDIKSQLSFAAGYLPRGNKQQRDRLNKICGQVDLEVELLKGFSAQG